MAIIKKLGFLLIVFLISCSCNTTNVTAAYESNKRTPLIVLIETDPWLEITHSDSPVFALYSDGLVIYKIKDVYKSTVISQEELASFKIKDEFFSLNKGYVATSATDQLASTIYVWRNGNYKSVGVYGNIRDNTTGSAFMLEEGEEEKRPRDETPEAFLDLYDQLISYQNKKAKVWVPQKIEILAWPWKYGKRKKAFPWPKDWPDINSPETIKRKYKYAFTIPEVHVIFLEAKYFSQLKKFTNKLYKYKAPAIMNNEEWAIAYRFPFPMEEMWQEK